MIVVLRLLHILTAVFWGGAVLFIAGFLLPAVREAGPAGGQVMGRVLARRYPQFIGIVAITTVLSGIGMYWYDTSVSSGEFARSRIGMVFGIGGIAGFVALLVGLLMVGRAAMAMGTLGAAIQASGGPPSAEQAGTLDRLRRRMGLGTNIAALCILIAIACMSIARYL